MLASKIHSWSRLIRTCTTHHTSSHTCKYHGREYTRIVHTHTAGWRHTHEGHTYENTHYLNWPKKKASITRTVFDVGEPAAVFPCCIAAGCSPGTRTTRVGLVSALHFRFQPEHFVFFFSMPRAKRGQREIVLLVFSPLPCFFSFSCFFVSIFILALLNFFFYFPSISELWSLNHHKIKWINLIKAINQWNSVSFDFLL